MKKFRIALIGALLLGMTSCATMLENMDADCNEDRSQPENCESFEFMIDSICD